MFWCTVSSLKLLPEGTLSSCVCECRGWGVSLVVIKAFLVRRTVVHEVQLLLLPMVWLNVLTAMVGLCLFYMRKFPSCRKIL